MHNHFKLFLIILFSLLYLVPHSNTNAITPNPAGDVLNYSFYSNNNANLTWQVGFRVVGNIDASYTNWDYGPRWLRLANQSCTGSGVRCAFGFFPGGAIFFDPTNYRHDLGMQWGTACIDPAPLLSPSGYYQGVRTWYAGSVNITYYSTGVTNYVNNGGGTLYFSGFYNTANCPGGSTGGGGGVSICTPLTCGSNRCGTISDGCGGTITCGGCGADFCGTGTNICNWRDNFCNSNNYCDIQTAERNAPRCAGENKCCYDNDDCNANEYCDVKTCTEYARVAARVYLDKNRNGNWDGEPTDNGLPGLTVQRRNASATTWDGASSLTTSTGGWVNFDRRQNPSNHDVRVLTGGINTCRMNFAGNSPNPRFNVTATPTLTVFFRLLLEQYPVAGTVWRDADNNGVISGGDVRVENGNIRVRTLDGSGNPTGLSSYLNSTNGNYWINGHVHNNSYQSQILIGTLPSGWSVIGSQRSPIFTINCGPSNGHDFLVTNNPVVYTTDPDLTIDGFSYPSGLVGENATATVTVLNAGNEGTGTGFQVRVRNGAGGTVTVAQDPLGAGAYRTFTATLRRPSTANTYTADVYADSAFAVAESNEDNNTASLEYLATPPGVTPPPPTPTPISGPTPTPIPGVPTSTPTPLPPTPTPTPVPRYTVSGGVYRDINRSGTKDTGEFYVSGTLGLSGGLGSVNSIANSGFTRTNVLGGDYTIAYISPLPLGYEYTFPIGTPPSINFTVGPGCSSDYTRASCDASNNIYDINFGIREIPPEPWFNGVGGDMRSDATLTNRIPVTADTYFSLGNTRLSPGIVFGRNLTLNPLTSSISRISLNNWLVRANFAGNSVRTSYESMEAVLRKNGVWTNATSISGTNILSSASSGVFRVSGNASIPSGVFNIPAGIQAVYMITGNLNINADQITIPLGSSVIFIVRGDIEISTETSLIHGIYSANRSVIVRGIGGGALDIPLEIQGSIIGNASKTNPDIAFIPQRDLLLGNEFNPAVQIIYRPDFVLNAPPYIKFSNYSIKELAPGAQ